MRTHKKTLFVDKKRSQRRDAFISLRWKINREAEGAGLFTTRIVLPGSVEWAKMSEEDKSMFGVTNMHGEARFLSRANATSGWLYHGDFRTIPLAVFDKLEELVSGRVNDRIKAAGLSMSDVSPGIRFGPKQGSGKNATYEMLDTKMDTHDVFNGKTLWGGEAEEWSKITRSDWGRLAAGYQIDTSCPSGVDLWAVVPERNIDLAAVERSILQFLELGEHEVELEEDNSKETADVIQGMIDEQVKRLDDMDRRERE
jgi:hypothetical protein